MLDQGFSLGIKTAFVTLLLISGIASVPHAQGQNIFAGLPYEESFIRTKIEQYSVSIDSTNAAAAIPENIYYRLLFQEILADQNLMSLLPEADAVVVNNLPAHEDNVFLAKDHKELTAVCSQISALTDNSGEILDAANSFDSSRTRREHDLDAHYVNTLGKLTGTTRELVLDLQLEFYQTKNIAYSTFDMSGLAADVPDIAKAVLINGCENFSNQLSTYQPQTIKLNDQLYAHSTPIDQ